jgi:predicted amidohydrolase
MVPTRAIENGAWIAVANKVGVEAETVVYCGRSCIISPLGQHVVQASTDRPEIITAEIDLDVAQGPPEWRRPELYGVLGRPVDQLPVTGLLQEAVVPVDSIIRIGALQLQPYTSPQAFLERVTQLCGILAKQEAQLIMLPGIADDFIDAPAYQAEKMLEPLRDLSQRLGVALAFPLIETGSEGLKAKVLFLVDDGATLGSYRKAHLTEQESETFAAGDEIPVFDTPYGRIGMMLDEEGVLTEVPRSLMLQGADLILWPARASSYPLLTVARSRADENKIFVALATPLEEDVVPHTALINPGGGFMAQALPDIEQGIAGQMAWLLTRFKEMAPNTNVVLNRQPQIYGRILTK